jgi:hypothetical protein
MIGTAEILFLLIAQSTVPREVVQLARVRHDMSAILARMPDYTCEEIVDRSMREKGAAKFKNVDTMRMDVAYVGGKELFGRHGAARIDKSHPNSFTGHGVTSNGDFTSHARSVFVDRAATTRYFGSDPIAGVPALRWDYTISTLSSGWTLNYAGRLTRVGAKGSFWVHPESLELMQLEVNATEIETGFPISATRLSIGYAKVPLGSQLMMIPYNSDLLVTNSDGVLERNLAQFRHCREYGADSAISFDK